MSPTRHYFPAAHKLDKPPKVVKPPKLPRGHFTVVRMADGTGVRQYNTAYLAAQAGRSKGGTNAQSRGTGYRWDSASARKAALKVWTTRWRKQRWTGNRTGRRPKMRKAVDHAALRAYYAEHPTKGITYDRQSQQWLKEDPDALKISYCAEYDDSLNTQHRTWRSLLQSPLGKRFLTLTQRCCSFLPLERDQSPSHMMDTLAGSPYKALTLAHLSTASLLLSFLYTAVEKIPVSPSDSEHTNSDWQASASSFLRRFEDSVEWRFSPFYTLLASDNTSSYTSFVFLYLSWCIQYTILNVPDRLQYRCISERTSLIHLGHLPSPRKGYVVDDPSTIVAIGKDASGTDVASSEDKEKQS